MQNLDTLKTRSQETVTNLIDRGKEQPDDVKALGVTAAAGVAGALVVTAGTKGLLAVVGLLANPPVALTIGALGGGALGWSYMQKQVESSAATNESESESSLASAADTSATDAATLDAASETAAAGA